MPCVQESPHGSIPLFLLPVSVGRCCSCKNIPQCVYSRPLLRKKCEANTLRWTFILPATQFRWTSIRWHPKHVISGISVATFENYSKLQRIWNLHPNSSNSPPPFCQQNRQKNMKIHISPPPPVFFLGNQTIPVLPKFVTYTTQGTNAFTKDLKTAVLLPLRISSKNSLKSTAGK